MKNEYYPFLVKNIDEISLPITLVENSRFKLEFIKIGQDLIDKIFPNQQVVKMDDSYQSPITFRGFRLNQVYQETLMGNIFLKTTQKAIYNAKDSQKYNKGLYGMIDIIHLFTEISLSEFIAFNENGKVSGEGSRGIYTHSTLMGSTRKITPQQITQIKEYFEKYMKSGSKKLEVSFGLLRNADINGYNPYPLKCSLIVVLIESFFLEGKRSSGDNFAFCLNQYLQTGKSKEYEDFYTNRGLCFHSGQDKFKTSSWRELHTIAKKIICDYLDDEKQFKCRVNQIKSQI